MHYLSQKSNNKLVKTAVTVYRIFATALLTAITCFLNLSLLNITTNKSITHRYLSTEPRRALYVCVTNFLVREIPHWLGIQS